jgi:phage baseplate assembly protein W
MPNPPVPPPPIGWPLYVLPDGQGVLRYPTLEESVRQTIQVILLTRPGEQLMRPDFGAGLEGFVNEPNTVTTRRRIRDAVAGAVARWEARVDLDRVDVDEVEGAPTQVRVEIAYRLRRTGAAQQIGLTMTLEP